MNSAHFSWKTLRLLAWHEGNLMVSRATMRPKGFLCDDAECALHMAALVVTDDDVEGVSLSTYSTEVLVAIDLIAREIGESAWLSALQWCVIACYLTTRLHFTWRPLALYLTISNQNGHKSPTVLTGRFERRLCENS